MSHHGRFDWRFFIFLCVLLILAAIGSSYESLRGQVSEDRRVAPLARISVEEAVEACRPWAAKLGIEGPLECVKVREDTREAFNVRYIVARPDGTHEFMVQGYTGKVSRYKNRRAMEKQATPRDTAAIRGVELQLAQELFDFFDLDHTAFLDHAWREFCRPNVLSFNCFVIEMDCKTKDVVSFKVHHREVQIEVKPMLTQEQCRAVALQTARAWRGVKDAWLRQEALARHENLGYYHVASDNAGVQRLVFYVPITVSRVPRDKYSSLDSMQRKSAAYSMLLPVDASNGECVNWDRESYYPHTVNEELVPFVNIGEKQFGMIGPLYPPRMRSGAPYIYVGYLDSLLWRGRVQVEGQAAQIQYAGRTWQVVADSKTATVDGEAREFEQPALMIEGYLYFSPQMINAITGWHVEYVAEENTVYIYSHLRGEQQEQTDN